LFKNRIQEKLDNLPKIANPSNVQISPELNQVIIKAEDIAKNMGDLYITEEHLFLALVDRAASLKDIFGESGIDFNSFKKIVEELRSGEQVTSNDSENLGQALKKYTIDLVELARK